MLSGVVGMNNTKENPSKDTSLRPTPKDRNLGEKKENKQSKDAIISRKLLRLQRNRRFKGRALNQDKTMFHYHRHLIYLEVPEGFSEQILYSTGMVYVCLAMGVISKSVMDSCDEILDKKRLRMVASEIKHEVKAKVWSLELKCGVHGAKKEDNFRHAVASYGRRFATLNQQQTLTFVAAKNNAVMGEKRIFNHMVIKSCEV